MAEITRCPFCEKDGTTSRLTPSPTTSATCMSVSPGYYDEQGRWVKGYDPNWYTRDYFCSNGHHFAVTSRQDEPDDVRLISTLTTSARVASQEETGR